MQEVSKQAVKRNPGETRDNKRNWPSLFRQLEVEKSRSRDGYGKSKQPDGDKVAHYPSGNFGGLARAVNPRTRRPRGKDPDGIPSPKPATAPTRTGRPQID